MTATTASEHRRRLSIPKETEKQVLVASRRRCCLCYFLLNKRSIRKGQIAHLNRQRERALFEDLVWLCLEHHDEFDSSTRQSKNFTEHEVRHHRDRLYRELEQKGLATIRNDGSRNANEVSGDHQSGASRHAELLKKPWRFSWLIEGKPEMFAYKSPNGFDGVCLIERIDLNDGRTVILCEEIDGNPGQSVTNAIELIALQLCNQFNIQPSNLVLLQHCDTHYYRDSKWDLVEFFHRSAAGFKRPIWMPLNNIDWWQFGFHPRVRRYKSTEEPKSMMVRSTRRPPP